MKKILKIWLLIFSLGILMIICSSCSSKPTLQTDKDLLQPDHRDMATFSVVYQGKTLPESELRFFLNDMPLNGNTFTSQVAGNYMFHAEWNGMKTNSVTIQVTPYSNLPILVIDTKSSALKDKGQGKVMATLSVYEPKGNQAVVGRQQPTIETPVRINIRGQSSADFPKKQYAMELINSQGNPVDLPLLGLPRESDWVLNGSYADKSLMRNYFAYTMGNKMRFNFTPKAQYCEVYLLDKNNRFNSETYKGVYLLLEKIKVSKNRVNIKKLTPQDESEQQITGGYLFSKDKPIPDSERYKRIKTQHNEFTLLSPNPLTATEKQKNYLRNYLTKFETVLYSPQFADPEEGYAKYLDVDSIIDMAIINDFMKNVDGMVWSTYLSKDRGGKIKAGPLWDFDLSGSNVNYGNNISNPEWFLQLNPDKPDKYQNEYLWIDRLLEDPAFREKVVIRYKNLREGVLKETAVISFIDQTAAFIAEASARNAARWPLLFDGVTDIWPNNKPYTTTPAEEISRMKKFLVEHGRWLDMNIDSLLLPRS